jgi:hypothetical protein
MDRRRFLRALAFAVPAIAASEQLLELLQPKKTIFLPPVGGWGTIDIERIIRAQIIREHAAAVDKAIWDRLVSDHGWMLTDFSCTGVG